MSIVVPFGISIASKFSSICGSYKYNCLIEAFHLFDDFFQITTLVLLILIDKFGDVIFGKFFFDES